MKDKCAAVALAATFLLANPAIADDGFAAIAAKIRAAEEKAPGIPMDRSLYADTVTYGHNIGPAHAQPADKLLAVIGPEQESFSRFVADRKMKLLRFVASGDTVVAESEMSGTLPDKTAFVTKTAVFFTIENGRIAKMELWADPILGQKFEANMEQDPAVIAARKAK